MLKKMLIYLNTLLFPYLMLKADLHLHTKEDPEDKDFIKYSAKDVIDRAALLGFNVLAFTLHNKVLSNEKLKKYASDKEILLIPGAEKTIDGKHVLIYNVKQEEIDKVKSFDDLNLLRRKNTMIIAPHPFFIKKSVGGKILLKYIDFFDVIEYSHFYLNWLNFNKKAVEIAKKYKKPILGTSDAHRWYQFNHTYALIDSKKDINSVIKAIKGNKTRLVTRPLEFFNFLKILFGQFGCMYRKIFKP